MNISSEFRKISGIVYPPFALDFFERYFYNYVMENCSEEIKNKYLPVYWTEINNSTYNRIKLQNELNLLNLLNKKDYFAVVQHADGIHQRVPDGTRIYFMGGGRGGMGAPNAEKVIPLPLIYDNPEVLKTDEEKRDKKWLVSFVGANTHKCRRDIVEHLRGKEGVRVIMSEWTNKIDKGKQDNFINITKDSKFTLAPRGYGPTSFRLYEALKLGSVPVYVYDELWLPYSEIIDWNKMIVMIHISDIGNLYNRLKEISDEEIEEKLRYYQEHRELFTYEGMSKYIISKEESV